jgi:hypothetical protein
LGPGGSARLSQPSAPDNAADDSGTLLNLARFVHRKPRKSFGFQNILGRQASFCAGLAYVLHVIC